MPANHKNALSFALGRFSTDEYRHDLMTLCHAVLSTAMVELACEPGAAAAKAAEFKCFASSIKLLEEKLGNSYSAVPNLPRTHFVTKAELPITKK